MDRGAWLHGLHSPWDRKSRTRLATKPPPPVCMFWGQLQDRDNSYNGSGMISQLLLGVQM